MTTLLVTRCIVNATQLAAVSFCSVVNSRNYSGMLSMIRCAHLSLRVASTQVTIKASFPCQHFDALLCLIPGGWRYGLFVWCIRQTHTGTADSVRARLRLFSHHCPLLLPVGFHSTAKNPLSTGSIHYSTVL